MTRSQSEKYISTIIPHNNQNQGRVYGAQEETTAVWNEKWRKCRKPLCVYECTYTYGKHRAVTLTFSDVHTRIELINKYLPSYLFVRICSYAVIVFTLNRPSHPASSAHPVYVLIPHPRETLILFVTDCETEEDKKIKLSIIIVRNYQVWKYEIQRAPLRGRLFAIRCLLRRSLEGGVKSNKIKCEQADRMLMTWRNGRLANAMKRSVAQEKTRLVCEVVKWATCKCQELNGG